MNDIFISYAREDLERTRRLAAALEAQGWSVFWDQRIPPGKTWHAVIGAALQEARCVIVAWSEMSIQKDWVREEAEEGKARKILVPVLFDRVRPPMGFRSVQAASLVDWDGAQPPGVRLGTYIATTRLFQVHQRLKSSATQK